MENYGFDIWRICSFYFHLSKVKSGILIWRTNECPRVTLLQSIMVLICIALHGNRPIPYSHYPVEIQLKLQQGEALLVFQTSSLLQHILSLLTFNL